MKDIVIELQDLQLEVDDFIEDMDVVLSKFASRTASLDEYFDQDRVLTKAKSILSRYESLKTELLAELEGEDDSFLSSQLTDLVRSIDAMKSQVATLTKTLKGMGKGLVPKTLEQFARQIKKQVQKYFENPRDVTHTKLLNSIRDDIKGTNGKKFFQTTIKIKGSSSSLIIVEPLDGDFTKNMPSTPNVFWKGKDIKLIEKWVRNKFEGTGKLSPVLDPEIKIWEGAVLEIKKEMKGLGSIIEANRSREDRKYHFKPGTVVKYTRMRSRGDFYLEVLKLNSGSENQYNVGDIINVGLYFGNMRRSRIRGGHTSSIYNSWGNMYALREDIKVKDLGQVGKYNNFDPGL